MSEKFNTKLILIGGIEHDVKGTPSEIKSHINQFQHLTCLTFEFAFGGCLYVNKDNIVLFHATR